MDNVRAALSLVARYAGKVSRTRVVLTAWRIALLYMAMMLCRVVFYYYNTDLIGEIESEEMWLMFKGSWVFDSASILYTSSLFLILSVLPLPLKWWNAKGYRIALFASYLIPAMVMLALSLADVVYFHYTEKRFTADELFFADNDNSTTLFFEFLLDNWYLALLFFVVVGLIVVGYRLRLRAEDMVTLPSWMPIRTMHLDRKTMLYALRIAATAIVRVLFIVAVGVYAITSIRGGFTRMARPMTLSNVGLYITSASPQKGYLILSNPFCVIRTMSYRVVVPKYYDTETLNSIYTPSHYPDEYAPNPMFGRYEGYNVVLFILESFSAEHSALLMPELHDGEGYTPNLDRLMSEGLLFSRCYANAHTSISAPPSIWSSIPSYQKRFMLMSESIADCAPLPRLLGDKGYHTSFFCGSEHGSMGFGAYAHLAGIKELYSMDTYNRKYPTLNNFDGKWGIWDEPFINYMGEELSSFPEPFFSSIFTITSHHPFVVPKSAKGELPAGTRPIHRPVAYTDRAIGRFMEKYKDEPWFERTLFVFIADHVSSERVADKTKTSPGSYHIVGFMYTPDGSLKQEYNSIFSHLDVMPTVLGLVGNTTPYFAIGRDIFNEPERMSMTVIDADFAYLGLTDDYFVDFKGDAIEGVYAWEDYNRNKNLKGAINADSVERVIKATIQQYYTHIKARNYFPDKRTEDSTTAVPAAETAPTGSVSE